MFKTERVDSLRPQIMVTSIESLPFELLSNILDEVAHQNLKSLSTYTYGLSQAPEPGRDVRMQRVIRGRTSPDALNWRVIEDVQQVNRKWHDWATLYAFRSLYISRWRGSERYIFFLYLISGRGARLGCLYSKIN